ncbi:hypothetical protein BVRB_3g068770 [Beta vulgaris subsp. vulgaris]|nr:hypothetical protein BVRB_3g068770 [Beta vulgaris subsp. vulgaris]
MALCEEFGLPKKVWSLDTPTRWNSTYKLLNDAIRYRDVMTPTYNEVVSKEAMLITNYHWTVAMLVRDVIKSFHNATNTFSLVYEPNDHLVIVECIKVVHAINEKLDVSEIKVGLDSMKVEECWVKKRSRLSPQSIKICVCKKDWDQAGKKRKD